MNLFNKKYNLIGFLLATSLALAGCRKTTPIDEEPIPIDTRYTDELTMATGDSTGAYASRSFLQGGVSVVTNPGHIDGDTTNFSLPGGQRITVRYLGIDTPESTSVIQPWGRAASAFVKEKLEEAVANDVTIRIEAESKGTDSTGNRYLGWVWLGERLLNLEVLENAYSRFAMNLETHYYQTFVDAQTKTLRTETRVYGTALDPQFNYSQDIANVTLKELNSNFTAYFDGSRIQTEGIITRKISGNIFIQDREYDEVNDVDKQYGSYIYVGPGGMDLSGFPLGVRVRLIGQVNQFNNSFQISIGAFRNELVVIDETPIEPVVTNITGNDGLADYEYMFVRIENLYITTKYYEVTKEDYTVYADTSQDVSIALRISGDIGFDAYAGIIEVGNTITVRGVVVRFHDGHQLLITSLTTLNDVVVVN